MFTQASFKLSQFGLIAGYRLVRECNFSFAGKIQTELTARVVACRGVEHVNEALRADGVTGLIVTEALQDMVPSPFGLAVADDPVGALNLLQEQLAAPESGQWLSADTEIHETAVVYPGAYVAPKDVVIGAGVIIYPNAVILPRSIISEGSTIGPGSVVGTDAFEIDSSCSPHRIIRQSGGVRVGKNVDIQAKCTIARATFGGFTEIGDESKFDCQVHLAHDCKTGKRVRIAACAEISGRVTIGEDAFLGPNVSISNGIKIGARAHVTIGAVVTRDVPAGGRVTGNLAIDHSKWLNFMRSIR